ncbi:claudin-18 [Lates calcarifer]|uniref:Claudin-18 n=2 Tax=Lates calcarifer TaxID=8187 RepID=A0AAJ7VD11_LATCA|nr:claudin-18 [Lates calcarifer]
MVSGGRQILGTALALIGFLGSIIICALPTWKVTAFIGANIVTSQVIWEGLWMNCVTQSTGQMQCKVYDSLLALPQDLQAARALVVIAIITGVFGILLAVVGGKCTNFVEDERQKSKVAIAAGIVFIVAGLLVLIPVCWTANTIIRDFYNPVLTNAQRRELYTMASMGMQMLASALCLLGWAGVIISCILPMWKVTAFVGSTIVTSQTIWEGIWMTCVVQSTGQMQCKPYDSLLALGGDLQAARALTVLAIATGGIGLILAFVGGKCTRFLDEKGVGVKGKVAVAAGAVLIVTGLLCLIPTSWAAGAVVRKFYSASIDAQRREIGACLYIGWGASLLLILGGGLFISSACPIKAHDTDKNPSVRYLVVRSSNGSRPPSARSLPAGAGFPRSQSVGASTKSQLYTSPPWEHELDQSFRQESENSWAPSTKSLKRPDSTKSEKSEALSTKSQLEKAEMENLSTVNSDNEDASSNPAKTYL